VCPAWLWLAFFETRLMDYPTGGDLASSQPPVPETTAESNPQSLLDAAANDAMWRREVSARLERYRMRRKPRGPKYPSLRLPFDSADSWRPAATPPPSRAVFPETEDVVPAVEQRRAFESAAPVYPGLEPEPELTAKIIEFPRTAAIPVYHGDELAEPVLERPRIVEAPEIVPPPPALGGIMIEPPPDRNADKRREPDYALPQTSVVRRIAAAVVDGAVILSAVAMFGAIFLRMNPERMTLSFMLPAGAVTATLLWALYQYLLLVYSGTTLGLLAARVRLARFDGSRPSRRLRRWRVVASYLSACALGLGYLWSLLDEDSLCWHDRITRTHVTPAA
jgi:uncharacterized RDD family membrane protein YckC